MKAGYGESALNDPEVWKAVLLSEEHKAYLKYVEELRQRISNSFYMAAKEVDKEKQRS